MAEASNRSILSESVVRLWNDRSVLGRFYFKDLDMRANEGMR